MRYDINDLELQNMVDNIKKRLIENYKDEIEGIDDHFINTLTQNFILQLENENIDLDKLMDQHNILLDTGNSQ
jgi:regulator of replication initiation timing